MKSIVKNKHSFRNLQDIAGPMLILCLCLSVSQSMAQKAMASTLFDSLYQTEIEKIQIYLNIDTFLQNKFTDKEQEGKIKVISKGDSLVLAVDISVRSKSRRRYCDFPPIKFDFTKSDLEAMGLDNEDEYKVVTHCLDQELGEEILLKEFMIYQLYRIITPISLRAKLVDVEYIDSGNSGHLRKKAVILESENEFAKKHKGKLCDCMGTPLDKIDGLQMEIVAMFQYMVGNTDMDHLVERNIKLIEPKDDAQLMIPVAYDFDFSALVNAPYVHKQVEDNRRIQRVYLGYKENESRLPEVIQLFKSKEEEILEFVGNFDLISKKERRKCLDYIKDFYREIDGDELVLPYKQR
ncbi:MAG: hypothetical protein KDC80_11055 [Saprospiraceae bacterium]|nr:hypothetical protein [Saprospiraceae bacterium]